MSLFTATAIEFMSTSWIHEIIMKPLQWNHDKNGFYERGIVSPCQITWFRVAIDFRQSDFETKPY